MVERKRSNCEVGEGAGAVTGDLNEDKLVWLHMPCLNEKDLRDLAVDSCQYLLLALSLVKMPSSIAGNKISGGFGLSSVQSYQRIMLTPKCLLFISWLTEQTPKIQSLLGLIEFEKNGR